MLLFLNILAAIVASPIAAPAQKAPVNTSMGPWRPAKGSPLEFARRGDAAIAGFRDVEGHTQVLVNYDGRGSGLGVVEIHTPTVFRLNYSWVHYPRFKKDPPMTNVDVIADGKTVDLSVLTSAHQHQAEASYRFYTGRTVADWVCGFPRYILGSIHGERAMSDLVARALRDSKQYSIAFETRSVVNRGVAGQQTRTVIERTAALAKRLGSIHIEIVCDAKYGVPVTAETSEVLPDRLPMHVTWLGAWRPHKFPGQDFRVPPTPAKKFGKAKTR